MFVLGLVKNTFNKVFNNLAKEFDVPVLNIQLGIQYKNGSHTYEAYKNFEKQKDINLHEYCGSSIALDLSGGVNGIDVIIGQSGKRYADELKCETDDVQIIMAYKEKELPMAVLMKNENGEQKKIRKIDIQKEFFN